MWWEVCLNSKNEIFYTNKDGSSSCLDKIDKNLNHVWNPTENRCQNGGGGKTIIFTSFRTFHIFHMYPYTEFEDYVIKDQLANPSKFKIALRDNLRKTIEMLEEKRGG